ncbi:MAG TPA: hypothetical protein VIL42_02225 [Sphingomicrobium sp.]|jgi:hypothetical protein
MADVLANDAQPTAAPGAVDGFVLKAALLGACLASLLTAMAVAADARLHPTGGPLNFDGMGFFGTVFLIGVIVGAPVSLLTLSAAIALAGGERLRRIPTAAAVMIGAAAGTALLWLVLGFVAGDWRDFTTIGFGAFYGACVAGLWSHLVRR